MKSYKPEHPSLIVIDGLLASGKSTIAARVRTDLAHRGYASVVVSIDDDCPGRLERREKSVIDWQSGALIETALDIARRDTGGDIAGLMYNPVSGAKDTHRAIHIPQQSVLIIEGVTVLERALQAVTATRSGIHRAMFLYIQTDEAVRNDRRLTRETTIKKLPVEEVHHRINSQAGAMRDYERDILHDRFARHVLRVVRG